MGRSSSITSLDLASNYFGDEQLINCEAIAAALRANGVLTALSLADCEIQGDGCRALAAALAAAPASHLARLDLQSNDLDPDEAAACLAEARDKASRSSGDTGAAAAGVALEVLV